MRTKRLCGFDLNGWRDIAARNWTLQPGEEEEFGEEFLSEGGLLGSVVLSDPGGNARWIGGPEAVLAPHGRGGGWGPIGHRGLRRNIRGLVSSAECDHEALAAAFTGLARFPSCSVAAIDDLPSTTEVVQENLLAALQHTRTGAKLLVWRPVLVALYAIGRGLVREGQRVGVICQAPEGFSLQVLRIRRESGQSSAVLAPERRTSGKSVASGTGYSRLVEAARALVNASLDETIDGLDLLAAVGRLVIGRKAPPELIRKANGTWRQVAVDRPLHLPEPDLEPGDFAELAGCDVTLFETLTEGAMKAALHRTIEKICRRQIPELPASAVASGALLAARRVIARDPVYFDFLPRISTIVLGKEGPENYELIKADETLPAGRVYRSEEPARLAVSGGQQNFIVYIRKEAERWPRKAVVDMGARLPETTPVDLLVEQAPAAGRARIIVQTPAARQFMVDWQTAEEVREEWDEIIANLAPVLPTIPKRLVLDCGLPGWEDDGGSLGLRTLLRRNVKARTVDWDALATKLAQRPNGLYCISSDGDLPKGTTQEDRDCLDRLTARALEILQKSAARGTEVDSKPVKFLTWQFRRCPGEVLPILLMGWEPGHPLLGHAATRILFYQGVGRIVSGKRQERAALKALLQNPVENWNWRRDTACAAFLLSRSDTSPLLLDREHVDLLGRRVLLEFQENIGSAYTTFNYAPFLLVGLLRWRLKEPRALVASSDPLAQEFSFAVDKTLTDLEERLTGERAFHRYVPILNGIKAELEGEGTNPDLLLDIYKNS